MGGGADGLPFEGLGDEPAQGPAAAALDEAPSAELMEVAQRLFERERPHEVRGQEPGQVVLVGPEIPLHGREDRPFGNSQRQTAQGFGEGCYAGLEEPRVEREGALEPRAGNTRVGGERRQPRQVGVGAGDHRLLGEVDHRDLEGGTPEDLEEGPGALRVAEQDQHAPGPERLPERAGAGRDRQQAGLAAQGAPHGEGRHLAQAVPDEDVGTRPLIPEPERGDHVREVDDDLSEVRVPAQVLEGLAVLDERLEGRAQHVLGDLLGPRHESALAQEVEGRELGQQARRDGSRAREREHEGVLRHGAAQRRREPTLARTRRGGLAEPEGLLVEDAVEPDPREHALREGGLGELLAEREAEAARRLRRGDDRAGAGGRDHGLEPAADGRPVAPHHAEAHPHRGRARILVGEEDPHRVAQSHGGEVPGVPFVGQEDEVPAFGSALGSGHPVFEEKLLARLALELEVREEVVPAVGHRIVEKDTIWPCKDTHLAPREG